MKRIFFPVIVTSVVWLNPIAVYSQEDSQLVPEALTDQVQVEESITTKDELYNQLEQYLGDQQWQQADQTTYELMLLIAGPKSEEQGYFDRLEWENFSCEEFQRIDSLWNKASQGQQGFTAQLNIFREVDGSSTYFDRIGWQQEGKWVVRWQYGRGDKRASYLEGMQPNFLDPPAGHLPALLQWHGEKDFRLDKAASCLAQ